MDFSQLTLADWLFDIGLGMMIAGAILLIRSYIPRREGSSS